MLDSTTVAPAQHPIRHRCRNVRCGSKLKAPTDDARDAFCCAACFGSYFRSRCRVCERPIDRKTDRRLVCKHSKCRHEFQRHPERFSGPRYPGVVLGHNGKGYQRQAMDVAQVLHAPVREHSRKPDEFAARIERLVGDVPRLELFAREQRPGWISWGNELEKFAA
jgi:MT-A70